MDGAPRTSRTDEDGEAGVSRDNIAVAACFVAMAVVVSAASFGIGYDYGTPGYSLPRPTLSERINAACDGHGKYLWRHGIRWEYDLVSERSFVVVTCEDLAGEDSKEVAVDP